MSPRQEKFAKSVLILAGIYNLAFAFWAVCLPTSFWHLAGMEMPNYLELWQCIGMIVGVYGVAYLIASINIIRFWPLVLVGLLGKVLGPIGFLYSISIGSFSSSAFPLILFNDLIWWVPFIHLLWLVYQYPITKDNQLIEIFSKGDDFSLDLFETSEGISVAEMSNQAPTLIVFLRHFGCTFCREAMTDIAAIKDSIADQGTRILLVHMTESTVAEDILAKYNLSDIPHISDPEEILYKKFKLRRGKLTQLFGPKVLLRGLKAGLIDQHGLGAEMGDSMQMPGVFLLKDGSILKEYIHQSAADRPNYSELSNCPLNI